jgi:ribosomal protein S18 acetylase RimI-like enzyme
LQFGPSMSLRDGWRTSVNPDTVLARVRVSAEVTIRPCRSSDLGALEWHGQFRAHRPLIADAWERHRRGEAVMLVADVAGFPIGQVWLDLDALGASALYLWALRVTASMRGLGIGSSLLDAAERIAARSGRVAVELECEHDNTHALGFYRKRGYRATGRRTDRWVLRKRVGRR